jgi:hypothetical protein
MWKLGDKNIMYNSVLEIYLILSGPSFEDLVKGFSKNKIPGGSREASTWSCPDLRQQFEIFAR